MAVITEQTPAEVIASVRAHRAGFDQREAVARVPSDDRSGGVSSGRYTAVAADDTNGYVDLQTGLTEIQSFTVDIRTSAGARKNDDEVIAVQAGGIIRVTEATTVIAVGDTFDFVAKGK